MLLNGFTSLLSLEMILLMFGGVIVGIIFGAIPGLSATMAIVLFLPITFNMGTTQAFALLVALYIGGVSGGLISAILINIPGSAMSIATCYDGHPMANQGHAQRALGIGVVFSFLGTVISLAIMMVAAPALASIAVKMSSFEIFSMTFCA
ncbi:MAG: tripartite tricarboxylate transporter permease, partial [Clostridia bacterium]|nr:tripartite tricarboxylate transporter permease [Clostridia bacterium]